MDVEKRKHRYWQAEKRMSIYQKELETMDRVHLGKIQLRKLQNMVDYCLAHSNFYQKKLHDAGIDSGACIQTLEDISNIPYTTKEELQDCYPAGLLAVPMSQVARIHASSGTTGKPTVGFYTKKDLEIWADCAARVLAQNGLEADDIMQISVGYGLFTGAIGFHQGAERIGCTIIPASTGSTEKQIVMMHDLGVTVLMATPSYACHLAERIASSGIRKEFRLKRILLGAERCSDAARKMIEDTLDVETADNYGLTEFFGPGVAGECPARDGMHITEDMFYPEIIDPATGRVLPDHTPGELVLTSLEREAMPLLRYRTRDLTSIDHAPCACGRTTARIRAPKGRTDDMFVFKGINVFPSQIEAAMSHVEGLSPHYRITLSRDNAFQDTAVLEVELSKSGLSSEDREKIRREFEHWLREIVIVRIAVELCEPGTLERFAGKSRRVFDHRYVQE